MNRFTYEELSVGMTAEFSREVTSAMLESFCEISGDVNPLHNDEEFARKKGYPGRVVYGMLTASLYSCLAGVYLPGDNCLLQSVQAYFIRPVFIGDRLQITGKIVEKNDSVRQVVIKAVIRNQDGEKVSRAKIEAGVI